MTAVQTALARLAKVRITELLFWLVAFALPWAMPSHALLVSEVAITALFAMSLDLVLGYTGIVSLGHAAFFGFGAYTAGLFAKHLNPDPLMGLALATLLTTGLGFLCSFTIMRGSDLTRLMVTLGMALILQELANKLDFVTGGADGLQGVVMGPVLGMFEFDLFGFTAAWYALAVTCVVFWLLRQVVHSPFGVSLQAIRDNRMRATSIGIAVQSRLVAVYTLAAAVAGLAGGLAAQTTGFASLDLFGLDRSADLLLMLVIGGTGWLWGGVVGAVVFKLMHTFISAITPQYWTFWMGLFLVVLVMVGRERFIRPWTWLGRGVRQ